MPVASFTPTGPAGTCDICQKPFGHYEGDIQCKRCEAVHCACAKEAEQRGDYSPDGEIFPDGTGRECSIWHHCLQCAGKLVCPNWGAFSTFTQHSLEWVESHGESCSQEWLTCDQCGAEADEHELRQAQPGEEYEAAALKYAMQPLAAAVNVCRLDLARHHGVLLDLRTLRLAACGAGAFFSLFIRQCSE